VSKDTFDAVLASVPQGRTAGAVTSRGTHWEPKDIEDKGLTWSAPPLMQRFDPGPFNKPDLTGLRVGRFTVVGYLHSSVSPKSRARWVVRCACGDYASRRTRALRKWMTAAPAENEGRTGDRCHRCAALQQIHFKYRTEGPRPVSDFFVSVLK